jgi:hypothetical protein
MDKTGVIALVIGLVLCVVGVYAIWVFLPDVILAVRGLIGITILLIGIMLAIFGALIFRD